MNAASVVAPAVHYYEPVDDYVRDAGDAHSGISLVSVDYRHVGRRIAYAAAVGISAE